MLQKTIFLLIFILIANACAYLDPGTGSYVLQIVIAAIAGSFFAIKMSWHKIKSKFKGGHKDDNDE